MTATMRNTHTGTGMPREARVVDRRVEVRQVVVERERAAVGEVREVGAEDAERAQRHDEGLDAALGDEQAVREPEHRAEHDGQRQRRASPPSAASRGPGRPS